MEPTAFAAGLDHRLSGNLATYDAQILLQIHHM